jgi:hypothetical protein
MVRSTTQREMPRPVPCGWPRSAIAGADASLPQQTSVLVVVVAAVRQQHVGPASGPADDAGHRGHLVEQGQGLGDVVAVPAGQ